MEIVLQVFSVWRKPNKQHFYLHQIIEENLYIRCFFSLERCPLSADLHYLVSSEPLKAGRCNLKTSALQAREGIVVGQVIICHTTILP